MKQQDIAIVIIVVFFAGIFSFFLSTKFIVGGNEKLNAETVAPVTSEFSVPDKKVFNEKAINPTVKIEIKPGENNQPFANEE
jgi:hypothetical protein